MKPARRFILWESVFFIFLLFVAAYVLLQSPLFEVRRIKVEGNEVLSAQEVIAVSGVHLETNIFKVNLKDAERRLSVVPLVKRAELKRVLPGTILIKLVERRPVALLPVKGSFIALDEEGVYLFAESAGVKGLPVITGVEGVEHGGPGRRVRGEGLNTALRTVVEMPAELVNRLSEICVGGSEIVLYTLEGVQCRLGPPEELKEKGIVVLKVLQELEREERVIEYIDVSSFSSPVVKYVE